MKECGGSDGIDFVSQKIAAGMSPFIQIKRNTTWLKAAELYQLRHCMSIFLVVESNKIFLIITIQ